MEKSIISVTTAPTLSESQNYKIVAAVAKKTGLKSDLIAAVVNKTPIAALDNFQAKLDIVKVLKDLATIYGIKEVSDAAHVAARTYILEKHTDLDLKELYIAFRLAADGALTHDGKVLDNTFYLGLFDLNKLARVLNAYKAYLVTIKKAIMAQYDEAQKIELQNFMQSFEQRKKTDAAITARMAIVNARTYLSDIMLFWYDYLIERGGYAEDWFKDSYAGFNPTAEEKRAAMSAAIDVFKKENATELGQDQVYRKTWSMMSEEQKLEKQNDRAVIIAKKMIVKDFLTMQNTANNAKHG